MTQSRHRALRQLLAEMFEPAELRLLVQDEWPDVVSSVPWDKPSDVLVSEFVGVLRRRGLLDSRCLAALVERRRHRADEIRRVWIASLHDAHGGNDVETDREAAPVSGIEAISCSDARRLLRKANKEDLRTLRALLKEALFVIKIQCWPHNKDDAQWVMSQIRVWLSDPVLASKHQLDAALCEAQHALELYTTGPKQSDSTSRDGYDDVRTVLDLTIPILPSPSEYLEAIFAYPAELSVSLLVSEAQSTITQGGWAGQGTYWDILWILANSEYGASALPFLEKTLTGNLPRWFDFNETVEIARTILLNDFDDWYVGIRGCRHSEDVERKEREDRC